MDGWTSSALIINYLRRIGFKNIQWFIHEGKVHGLSDSIDYILNQHPDLVVIPDAGSNDYEQHKKLNDAGIDFFILDHHEADKVSEYGITINNQLCDYPDKFLSGAGVAWQFCREYDKFLNTNEAMNFIDLAALGMMSDMMNITESEVKEIILTGFERENIKNPFIQGIRQKHDYSLNKGDYKVYDSSEYDLAFTPIGCAFFITPYINALTRSGTLEEQKDVFNAFLEQESQEIIDSTKRGHRPGEKETRLMKALRIITNVKNRQTRDIDKFLPVLEEQIKEKNMLKDKVLIFLLKGDEVRRNIAGLCANKMANKYQRPCLILSYNEKEDSYGGSMRGYNSYETPIKEAIDESNLAIFTAGHSNAAGVAINASDYESFLSFLNNFYKNQDGQIVYDVDFSWDIKDVDAKNIIRIAAMNNYIGTGFPRPVLHITGFIPTESNMSVLKGNTLKYEFDDFSMIQFSATDEFIEKVMNNRYNEIEMICECVINEWGDTATPQLIIKEVEWKEGSEQKGSMINAWNF